MLLMDNVQLELACSHQLIARGSEIIPLYSSENFIAAFSSLFWFEAEYFTTFFFYFLVLFWRAVFGKKRSQNSLPAQHQMSVNVNSLLMNRGAFRNKGGTYYLNQT